MSERDPRFDPQPGDEIRIGDGLRRVIERRGQMLLVEAWGQRYWTKVNTWHKWFEHSGAIVVTAEKQEE